MKTVGRKVIYEATDYAHTRYDFAAMLERGAITDAEVRRTVLSSSRNAQSSQVPSLPTVERPLHGLVPGQRCPWTNERGVQCGQPFGHYGSPSKGHGNGLLTTLRDIWTLSLPEKEKL
jgi:hypothetical protein